MPARLLAALVAAVLPAFAAAESKPAPTPPTGAPKHLVVYPAAVKLTGPRAELFPPRA